MSAAVGKGSGDLLDAVVERLPAYDPAESEDTIGVAVLGRPNVGKSSLVNRLLGEDRHVVAAEAGTTRDAIDSLLRYRGKNLNFIDTAGLRRKAKVQDDLEFYSTLRTERAVERAEVCVLVVDATLGLHNQDLRIATEAWDRGCGLVVAVNKWDLIEEKDANTAHRGQEELIAKAPFLRHVPFVYRLGAHRPAGPQGARSHPRGGRGAGAAHPDGGGEPGAGAPCWSAAARRRSRARR